MAGNVDARKNTAHPSAVFPDFPAHSVAMYPRDVKRGSSNNSYHFLSTSCSATTSASANKMSSHTSCNRRAALDKSLAKYGNIVLHVCEYASASTLYGMIRYVVAADELADAGASLSVASRRSTPSSETTAENSNVAAPPHTSPVSRCRAPRASTTNRFPTSADVGV